MSGRWIPEKGDSGQIFASFKYWATADLGLGVDYRPLIDNVSITATYRAVSEDPLGWRPAVILGTSEDDFSYKGSDVESRSYFFTLSKAMPDMKFWGVTPSPYAGAVWIEEIDKIRPLVGVHLRVWSYSFIQSGVHSLIKHYFPTLSTLFYIFFL